MLSSPSWSDIRSRVSKGSHYRYTAYLLFLILMMYKLIMLDHHLHITNMKLDQADYVIAVGSLLLISFWTLWLPPRGRLATLTLLNLLWTGILYADLIYYRYFDDFITVPVLMQAGQVGSLGDSIRSLIHAYDLFFLSIGLLLSRLLPWWYSANGEPPWKPMHSRENIASIGGTGSFAGGLQARSCSSWA